MRKGGIHGTAGALGAGYAPSRHLELLDREVEARVDRPVIPAGRPLATKLAKAQVEKARAYGRESLQKVMEKWVAGLDHEDWAVALRCAREIADRCGLPALKEIEGVTGPDNRVQIVVVSNIPRPEPLPPIPLRDAS